MATQIFVNLPVKNLSKTIEFFTKLDFAFNPEFTDEKAACLIIDENIFVMLLTEDFFKKFTQKEISDATKSTEVILTLSAESREKVDEMISKVLKAGGRSPKPPQDHGWMFGRGFQDLDGHLWEVMYMDMNALKNQSENQTADTVKK
ncbi:MAG: VOC family protein [Bacteroidetes bacterium]|nr:VOC family protein [Bacteroidota bacterium]